MEPLPRHRPLRVARGTRLRAPDRRRPLSARPLLPDAVRSGPNDSRDEQLRQAASFETQRVADNAEAFPAHRNGSSDAWSRANPDVDEDWEPKSIDVTLDDEAPASRQAGGRIARKLKVEPTAIKVESGLAYVLVDDEGRPVLR